MTKRLTLFDYINTVIMLIVALIIIFPILNVISISFSEATYVVQNKISFFPRGFNLEAYKLILCSNKIPRAYLNTIIYTIAGVAVNVVMTAIAAYPLARKGFFGKKFFMSMIIFTMFFNGGIIPNYIIVRNLGMINTIWAIIIPNALWTVELLIMKSFYQSISPSLYESAYIDGASEYKVLFRIFIPLSKASIASLALFFFIGHWNSYFIPMIYLNDIEKAPLQVVLKEMLILNTAKDIYLDKYAKMTPETMKNATIFISMVPILIVYPFAQKYFVSGIMLGSIKE